MKLLFVCLGNICRSPIADGVLRKLAQDANLNWVIDSAGTSNYHIGEAPDIRAQRIAQKYKVDLSSLRARQFSTNDFDEFDYIFAMDSQNYQDIIKLARDENDILKVELFLNRLEPGMNRGVTDPWFNDVLFEPVFLEIEKTCKILLKDMRDE